MPYLAGLEIPEPDNPYTAAIDAVVAQLEQDEPLTASARLRVVALRSLAQSIIGGLSKNRAVGGDVERLLNGLNELTGEGPDDPSTAEGSLTDDDRAILAALSTRPTVDAA